MVAIENVLHTILNYGPAVFLPIIMLILGLILRMKVLPAISAALLLGVAFAGVSLVIGYILGVIGPVGQQMVQHTGLNLTAYDLGWTPAAAISWAWKFALMGFVIEIAVNIIMLWARWTEILNVDLWNVWHLSWMGALITMVTGSYLLALVWDVIWVVMQLKFGDWIRSRVHELTGIPGVTTTHPMFFAMVWLYPIYWLVDRIPGLNKISISSEKIREKLGVFGENHVLGFIVGCIVAIAARQSIAGILQTGIEAAAALTLFPMVSGLFMRALAPIADSATEFMKKRFPDRVFYIGLDWPILAGISTIWTVSILTVPFVFLGTVLLPHNIVVPFGSIMMLAGVVPAVVLTRGDVVKSWVISILTVPVFLYSASWVAPFMTRLATSTGVVTIPPHVHYVTWFNQDTPVATWFMAEVPKMLTTKLWWLGAILLVLGLILMWVQARYWKSNRVSADNDSPSISTSAI
jgi:PTS system galactitol-specific IIC component